MSKSDTLVVRDCDRGMLAGAPEWQWLWLELAFLVFRPVPPELESALDALMEVPRPHPFGPGTRYVTDNPNWDRTPYWDIDF